MVAAAASLLLALQPQAAAPSLDVILARVSTEAELFALHAPNIIGQETLRHRGRKAPPRFRPRIGAAAVKPPEATYATREIVSEYGFSRLKEAPEALREFRQVVSVDGRLILPDLEARTTLAINMKSEDDRARRRMLQSFERLGTVGAATDFGQTLLMFGRRHLADYEFTLAGDSFLGADRVLLIGWRQKEGPNTLKVYQGRELVSVLMQGRLWVRAADFLPLRITMTAPVREEDGRRAEHHAEVDYTPSRHGLLPAAVRYSKTVDGVTEIENTCRYDQFKIFAVEAEIKFTPLEEPPPAPQ